MNQNTQKTYEITEQQLQAVIQMLTKSIHREYTFEVILKNIEILENLPQVQEKNDKQEPKTNKKQQ